ncbi:hypothetical protein GJ744_012318 [Endocarpon pusillum]|uniref:Uncharacterized protein n=1 Tax=Endocarpon pusillum TaxID=364733 RepID=A0A8H7AFA6_9EURO|nr:hypothetical protein GJ744_012318 [Endocarpon pusillum]
MNLICYSATWQTRSITGHTVSETYLSATTQAERGLLLSPDRSWGNLSALRWAYEALSSRGYCSCPPSDTFNPPIILYILVPIGGSKLTVIVVNIRATSEHRRMPTGFGFQRSLLMPGKRGIDMQHCQTLTENRYFQL